MSKIFNIISVIAICIIVGCNSSSLDKNLVNVRQMVDTVGFAHLDWQVDSVVSRINRIYSNELSAVKFDANTAWRVAICPHDDYTYASWQYPALLRSLKAKTVIVFGVAHKARQLNISDQIVFDSYSYWHGPYRNITVSPIREELMAAIPNELYQVSDSLQKVEHSVESMLPFVQHFNRDVEIIPILVPFMNADRMSEISEQLSEAIATSMKKHNLEWGKDIALLITTDAVHYGDEDWGGKNMAPFGVDSIGYAKAVAHEHGIIDSSLVGDINRDKIKLFINNTVQPSNYKEMKKFISLLCTLAFIISVTQASEACTSIRIKTTDGLVFYARTMEGGLDFQSKVTVIPKGTAFQGTLPDNSPKGLKWTAKYGLVGMNALGQALLTDGINEMGLVVGNLLFPGYADYEPFDPGKAKVTLAQYEVATWLLSNYATVAEVRQAMSKVRVVQGPQEIAGILPLHFAVHDAQGNSLVIEYVKGKLHIYDNPLGVMTNSPTFDWMTTYLSNFVNLSAVNVPQLDLSSMAIKQFGQGSGMLGLPGDFTPPSRLVRMVALTQAALPVKGPDAGLNLAMTIINNVDIPKGSVREKGEKGVFYDITQWVVAADLANKKYYFHTYNNKNWRYVDVNQVLQTTKGIQFIALETPADYPKVTTVAK